MPAGVDAWRSTARFLKERIRAAAIYCSDGRYGDAFDEFLHERLKLPRYDRVAVPGGAACLAGHFMSYRDEDAVLEQLRFLIVTHALERVVLIAHRGCGYYLKRLHVKEEALAATQVADLAKAAARIAELGSHVGVEAYMASVEGEHVLIEPVAL